MAARWSLLAPFDLASLSEALLNIVNLYQETQYFFLSIPARNIIMAAEYPNFLQALWAMKLGGVLG